MRFFAVVFVIFSIGACVLAKDEYQLKGPGTKRIVFDEDTFEYKIDYRATYAFYNTTDRNQKQYYTLHVGGCKVEFRAEYCLEKSLNRHHEIQWANAGWQNFHDDFPSGTVNPSSISFRGYVNYNIPCDVQFDSSSMPGRYVIDVSLSGDVSPDLVVNFVSAEPTTTTPKPTTVSSTQASSTTLSTSTPVDISTTLNPPFSQRKKCGLESCFIDLIVAVIILALLAIALCASLFCCYRSMQKAKTQKVVKNGHTTVRSTMGTVRTAPGTLVKETNLYGPEMMYFGRNATPVDPNAKSEATNLATQINPALSTGPMQAAK